MASLLAIDWDERQLHLVAVRTQRKGVRVEWGADWDMGEELTVRSAEAIGKRLRDFLKSAQVTAAAVIVAIGREKVILKDVRFPVVAAGDEAALVRFQATKEVTEAPDLLEIDYAARPNTSGGERQALAVLTRKDVLAAVRNLCRGAGLKLLAVAPRPFGAPYAVERALQAAGTPAATDAVQAVLTVGLRWAELCLFRGHDLLLARSVPAGPALVDEIKRSLAVFAAQNAGDPRPAVPAVLYVFANGNSPVAALTEVLAFPVTAVSPLTAADAIAPAWKSQGPLVGAVGLAQRWAVAGGLPVNLAAPKRPQPVVNPGRRRWLTYGASAALVLMIAIASMSYMLSTRKANIQRLTQDKVRLDDDLRLFAQDRVDIDALKDWDHGRVPWLDELYDLTARFPFEKGFRINHYVVEPVSGKKGVKDAPAARVRITGVTPAGKDVLVQHLRDAISRDAHLKATVESIKGGKTREFIIRIDVFKQPASRYDTVLAVPAQASVRKGGVTR